jgi:photosystem II stability/assembly factor-like uncharacterized protein
LWAVGDKDFGKQRATILESDDSGEHWKPRDSSSQTWLRSIFGSSDGKRLWAVGLKGAILESYDGGEHWKVRGSGTSNNLVSIFGTSDGKRLWAVGDKGTIVGATVP